MAVKTGRAWLGKYVFYYLIKNFIVECDNPMMAETSLELANQVINDNNCILAK